MLESNYKLPPLITSRAQTYLDSHLDPSEHGDFIAMARLKGGYSEGSNLTLDSEWQKGAVAGWQSRAELDHQQRDNEWKLAVDRELTTMQSTSDNYDSPAEAVTALIDWHVAVASDPAVNGQQRGEPVGYIDKHGMESLTRSGVSVTVYPTEGIETIPVYTTPQPATPAQEPSDDLKGLGDGAYRQYIDQMSRPECKGVEYKLLKGTFGLSELKAHNKAHEYLGRHRAFSEAYALLARYGSAQPIVPEGWKLVPVEPTQEMIEEALRFQAATVSEFGDEPHHDETYRAMLAAAPKFGEEE